jgi:hypothetical protein
MVSESKLRITGCWAAAFTVYAVANRIDAKNLEIFIVCKIIKKFMDVTCVLSDWPPFKIRVSK